VGNKCKSGTRIKHLTRIRTPNVSYEEVTTRNVTYAEMPAVLFSVQFVCGTFLRYLIGWLLKFISTFSIVINIKTRVTKHYNSMFIPCIFRRSRNNQHYAQIAPLLYSICRLLHVWKVVCHHQGASGSVWVTSKYRSMWRFVQNI
jgi:hypothetical protein